MVLAERGITICQKLKRRGRLALHMLSMLTAERSHALILQVILPM